MAVYLVGNLPGLNPNDSHQNHQKIAQKGQLSQSAKARECERQCDTYGLTMTYFNTLKSQSQLKPLRRLICCVMLRLGGLL